MPFTKHQVLGKEIKQTSEGVSTYCVDRERVRRQRLRSFHGLFIANGLDAVTSATWETGRTSSDMFRQV